MAGVRQKLLAIIKWLLIIELGYLLLINLALQLQLTQNLVNKIRPEKFHVSWESAWSWYPFRVHAQGVVASGQSRGQQWQAGATSASGSINLLPLVLKRVIIRDVNATDIDYRQRPRLKTEKDYSALLPHFPDIEGWEIAPADTSPRKKRRPWKVSLINARAEGKHKIWIFNINGGGSGELYADLTYETQGGPFSLDIRDIDMALDAGYVLAGTDLSAQASDLAIRFRDMDAAGEGVVRVHTLTDTDTPLGLDIDYDSLRVTREGDSTHFLEGDGLKLRYAGFNYANLTADIFAAVDDISGTLQLSSTDLSLDGDGQALEANLLLDAIIAGGVPREMRLDLSGSKLTLDQVTVAGEATLDIAEDLIVIPSASILGDKAEAGAKVAFTPNARTGMIYARYKKLDVLLKLMGQEKDLDIFKVREKFEGYELEY